MGRGVGPAGVGCGVGNGVGRGVGPCGVGNGVGRGVVTVGVGCGDGYGVGSGVGAGVTGHSGQGGVGNGVGYGVGFAVGTHTTSVRKSISVEFSLLSPHTTWKHPPYPATPMYSRKFLSSTGPDRPLMSDGLSDTGMFASQVSPPSELYVKYTCTFSLCGSSRASYHTTATIPVAWSTSSQGRN